MKGYTLIEIVVVMGTLGVIMVATTMVLTNSFRARTRIAVADVVEQSGSAVISELKGNIISAVGVGMTCVGGDTLVFQNINDGGITTFKCYEGVKIASESANGNFDLTPKNVTISGCNNFASCDLYPGTTDRVTNINFAFTIEQGDAAAGAEKFVSRDFKSSVTVRN